MNYVIMFFVMMFALMTWSSETERNDWDAYFKEEMRIQASLWDDIQAIRLDKKIMLVVERQIPQPCPINENRKRDESYYGCLVYHFKFVYDTLYVDKEYILENYRYPEFTEDSTVCHVEESGITYWYKEGYFKK